MEYCTLGRTGISVSRLAFGAGPISGWMDLADPGARLAVVERAVSGGVNWIDTAAGYGSGRSEQCVGEVLDRISAPVHVATKVRVGESDLERPEAAVRQSVRDSLERLRRPSVTLLQLHNAITERRGDIHASLTPEDVLRPGGIADAMESLQTDGKVVWLGLTGIGHPSALRRVIQSDRFVTMQTPYHMLNPTAGHALPADVDVETHYDQIFQQCSQHQMGVFAIRVFAGGALLLRAPSPHTLITPYFPRPLFERDVAHAKQLRDQLADTGISLLELALRFTLSCGSLTSAIVGWGNEGEVDASIAAAGKGRLPEELVARVCRLCTEWRLRTEP